LGLQIILYTEQREVGDLSSENPPLLYLSMNQKRSIITVLDKRIGHQGDQIKDDLMEGEYNTLGGDEKLVQNFSRKT
jgi:hypothetical protein